jgi:hypothetical protein
MSENLSLLFVTLQSLILNQLFNEKVYLSVKNNITVEVKRKTKIDDYTLGPYRQVEKELLITEQTENKKVADTLVYKSQNIPSKRHAESNNGQKFKRAKRETVRIMNEDFPVYKTMQFIDELPFTPVFSREESMPSVQKGSGVPKESKDYLEVELRVNRIAKNFRPPQVESIQKFILIKSIAY